MYKLIVFLCSMVSTSSTLGVPSVPRCRNRVMSRSMYFAYFGPFLEQQAAYITGGFDRESIRV